MCFCFCVILISWHPNAKHVKIKGNVLFVRVSSFLLFSLSLSLIPSLLFSQTRLSLLLLHHPLIFSPSFSQSLFFFSEKNMSRSNELRGSSFSRSSGEYQRDRTKSEEQECHWRQMTSSVFSSSSFWMLLRFNFCIILLMLPIFVLNIQIAWHFYPLK